MMEYIIMIIAQFFGVFFHNYLKIKEIDERRPDDTLMDVVSVFYRENLLTLILSAVIVLFTVFVHFVIGYYTDLPQRISYYDLIGAGVSLVLGYQGQRIVYKALNKGTDAVDRGLDKMKSDQK